MYKLTDPQIIYILRTIIINWNYYSFFFQRPYVGGCQLPKTPWRTDYRGWDGVGYKKLLNKKKMCIHTYTCIHTYIHMFECMCLRKRRRNFIKMCIIKTNKKPPKPLGKEIIIFYFLFLLSIFLYFLQNKHIYIYTFVYPYTYQSNDIVPGVVLYGKASKESSYFSSSLYLLGHEVEGTLDSSVNLKQEKGINFLHKINKTIMFSL